MDFLSTLPPEGPPRIVIQNLAQTKAVHVTGRTLHVHTLRLWKKDELRSILLTTHFGLVDEVRVHNFHIYRYLWDSRVHVRIVQTRWE